ncbi:hypothetical protein AB6A40_010332 [Gnathostoma spinigerum]|uniref:Fibronectin type-III domain-containing protein n=1 Tax=Gnathostoma spinigerum TaxID=75299 RepID=A0ABD6F1J4_9BILA
MQVPVTPERCSAPSFSELSDGILRVKWAPVENASSSLIYQLLRVNVQPPTTMYKGESTMFDVKNAIPGEEMEVQVRAIATGEDGTESEGPWSHVAVGQISVKAPPPPSDVVLTNDKVLCWKPPSATPLTGYVVERELLLLCDGSPAVVSSEVEPKSDESREWTKCAVANDTIRKNVGDGKPGCEYQVRVAAVNSGGVGQPSEWIHFTMPSAAPSAPSSLRAVAEGVLFAFKDAVKKN